jgi:hypothetical protein
MFSNIDWADLAERAIWTFAQGFLGAFTIVSITDLDALGSAAIAGATAGVAAVLSLVKNIVKQIVEGQGV